MGQRALTPIEALMSLVDEAAYRPRDQALPAFLAATAESNAAGL